MSLIGRKPPTPAELDPLGYWSRGTASPTLLDNREYVSPGRGRGDLLAPFPGPRTPRQLRSSVARARAASKRIFAPAVHPKYGQAKYGLHTLVAPGKRITIVGVIPPGQRYVGPRGEVNTKPIQIRRVFRIGDLALTPHGLNLDYMGRIRGITEKTVKVVEHEAMGTGRDKTYHMSLHDFAERNAFFDEEKSRKKNREWTD